MSLIAYSNCHVRFTSNDNDEDSEYESSNRCLIEIRDSDNQNYILRAIDLDDNKKEIFKIPITTQTKYTFGSTNNEADRIESMNGTYYVWLNTENRETFHGMFTELLHVLNPHISTKYSETQYTTVKNTNTAPKESREQQQTSTSDPVYCNPKDILVDVHNLNKFIHQGKSDEAAEIASQFAQKGIHLQAKYSDNYKNEESFQIRVQFDGNEYGIEQTGALIPVDVYLSTTIRELRAIFECTYHYLPSNQYFFVNGKLVHDDDTMEQLNVGPKSLFVLFLITHPKKFQTKGPWQCPLCTMINSEENLKCNTCSATRKE